jgi:hypothetical protein
MPSVISEFVSIKYSPQGKMVFAICNTCKIVIKGYQSAHYVQHLQNKHKETLYKQYKQIIEKRKACKQSVDIIDDSIGDISESETDGNDTLTENNGANNYKRSRITCQSSIRSYSTTSSSSVSTTLAIKQGACKSLANSFAEMSASLALPHSLSEHPKFRQFLRDFCSDPRHFDAKFINRRQVHDAVIDNGNALFNNALQELKNKFCSLVIDGWTNHEYGPKVTNIIVVSRGRSYLLWSDVNYGHDKSDSYLVPLITDKIELLISHSIPVTSVCTDNASNMINLGTSLYQNSHFGRVVLHICCNAHTFQLMVNEIFNIKKISEYFHKVLAIQDLFTKEGGKKMRVKLDNIQRINQSPSFKPLKLIKYNQTRWWSKCECIRRIVRLRPFLRSLFLLQDDTDPNPITPHESEVLADANNDSFWPKIDMILQIADTFQLATDMVQSESATLLDVSNALKGIKMRASEWNLANVFGVNERSIGKFNADVLEVVLRRENQYIRSTDHYAVRAVELLCDVPYRDWIAGEYKETIKWLTQWGADVIKLYPSQFSAKSNGMDRDNVINMLEEQLTDFLGGDGEFQDKIQDKNKLLYPISVNSFEYNKDKSEDDEIKMVNWVRYWQKNNHVDLGNIACILLTAGVTETACEVSFSLQQTTHSKIRNRMTPDVVEAEMRYRYNQKHNNLVNFAREIKEDDTLNDESDDDSYEL